MSRCRCWFQFDHHPFWLWFFWCSSCLVILGLLLSPLVLQTPEPYLDNFFRRVQSLVGISLFYFEFYFSSLFPTANIKKQVSLPHFLNFWGIVLYTHFPYHNDSIIVKTDAHRKTHEERKQEGKRRKTSSTIFLPLTLLQGSKGLFWGLHVRGCWRPNINFIFWLHCYDRHVVSFLFS